MVNQHIGNHGLGIFWVDTSCWSPRKFGEGWGVGYVRNRICGRGRGPSH